MIDNHELRKKILRRWVDLKTEREPFVTQWEEISRHVTPASGRFLSGESNRRNNEAKERFNNIYNNTATKAANILAAGLMSGLTDPSTQWFALTTGSPDLDESHDVKIWLDQVQRILEMAFTRTNTYQALHHMWREVGCYGTAASFICEDWKYGFQWYPLNIGEYCIGVDFRGTPNTLYRKYQLSASQLVEQYGYDNVSDSIRHNYDNGHRDKLFKLIQAVEPREDYDPTKKDNKNMPYRQTIILVNSDGCPNFGVMEESGFNEFPCVVIRWGASASDVYSEECPGMIAIGDAKELNHHELQKGNAIDLQVDPPLIMPVSARENETNFLPGGRSYIDSPSSANQVQPAFNVNLNLQYLAQDIAEIQNRINSAFNVDMFLMITQRNKEMTATEVAQRAEEKSTVLGPVVSRFNHEGLRPTIERVYNILARAGQIPPAPQELQNREIQIEYTSLLARSQRAIRASALDQFLGRVGQVAQFKPEVLNKIDAMAMVDEYADYLSVAPSVVVPTDKAMEALQAQQEAQAQAQQMQAIQQGADAVAKLGKVPNDDSTLGGGLAKTMSQAVGA